MSAKFGDIASGSVSDYGGYSIYGTKTNPLGCPHYVEVHGANFAIPCTDLETTC